MNRTPLLTALLNPVNLAMLALAVAAGLCAAWWLAPAGIVLWLVMVVLIARDPGLQITFTRQNREPLSQRYQIRFDRLERAQISIFNAMGQSAPAMQRVVEPLQSTLDDLVEQAYRLGLRMSALDNHYAVQRLTNNFQTEIDDLQKKSGQSADPAARREYEATIQSLQGRQNQLQALAGILDRFEAQLTGTQSAVDGVVTSVINLKGRSPQQAKEKMGPLLATLQTEQGELRQFEEEAQQFSGI